ncbi:MAG: MmgE/PrpD family protein, partial [Candidatus Heimdallarchaeota archaeon]
ANSVQVFFKDGSSTDKIEIQYPLGHRRRRTEAIPLLEEKCQNNLATRYPSHKVQEILSLLQDQNRIEKTPVHLFLDLLQI